MCEPKKPGTPATTQTQSNTVATLLIQQLRSYKISITHTTKIFVP